MGEEIFSEILQLRPLTLKRPKKKKKFKSTRKFNEKEFLEIRKKNNKERF